MKKVLKILTLIMLTITIINIGNTYSKYYASANTNNLFQDVGSWIIKVNELDIYSENGETVEFTLNEFSNFTNPNTDPNKISPGNKGYTDIVIDPSGTDVAVRYDINLNQNISDLSTVWGINIWLEIQEPSENMRFVQINESSYSGIISLADVQANKIATIRCYIEWENDETLNEEVSALGNQKERYEVVMPLIMTVSQYLGEELE